MCFNTPNNWQLGWYSAQEISINPLTELSASTQTFTLNGIDDYTGDNSGDKYVAVRLTRVNTYGDYYIGLNKATGINSGTLQSKNMLTITEKEGGEYDSYPSILQARLTEGMSYTLENFDGSGVDIEIKFISLSSTDAVIEVTDNNENENECDSEFKLELKTDQFPEDISWTVKDSSDTIVLTSPEYKSIEIVTEVCCVLKLFKNKHISNIITHSIHSTFAFQEILCLSSGLYTFKINDSFGGR